MESMRNPRPRVKRSVSSHVTYKKKKEQTINLLAPGEIQIVIHKPKEEAYQRWLEDANKCSQNNLHTKQTFTIVRNQMHAYIYIYRVQSEQSRRYTQSGKRVVKSSIVFSYWLSSLGLLLSPDKSAAALQATLLLLLKNYNDHILKNKQRTAHMYKQIKTEHHECMGLLSSHQR